MAAAIEILVAGVSSAALLAFIWRVSRHVVVGGSLEQFTVSREWLVRHQGDDRS